MGAISATGTTVQAAIDQIDASITTLTNQSNNAAHVTTVQVSSPVTLSGTAINPIIGLEQTGVMPSTYDGFTIDAYGRVTNYVQPNNAVSVEAGNAAVTVTQVGPMANIYQVSIKDATSTTLGAVQLIPTGNISNSIVTATNLAVSWGNLQEWWNKEKNFLAGVTAQPIPITTALSTLKMVYTEGAVVYSTTADDVRARLGGSLARGIFTSTSVGPQHNILSVLASATSSLISMGYGAANYIVSVSPSAPVIYSVQNVNNSQFVINWFDHTGTPTAPPSGFQVNVVEV
jgi:hypothetical protein